jgi:3'-phosphoadenosine 5'-phosphosulfate sulfotransferase (PAPS reductase)/FAD synthetase
MNPFTLIAFSNDELLSSLDIPRSIYLSRKEGISGMLNIVKYQISELLKRDDTAASMAHEDRGFIKYGDDDVEEQVNAAAASSSHDVVSGDYSDDPRRNEVAMLLSGGVDSSVALKLLLLQGYKVRAYYLKIWLADELQHLSQCPWEEDVAYAREVCEQLGVPLEVVSLQKEYYRDVVRHMLDEAKAGRTPNPDVLCNSRIKFGAFINYIGR